MRLLVTFPILLASVPTLFGQVSADTQPADGSKDYIVVFKDKTATRLPDRFQHLRQRARYEHVPAAPVRLNAEELKQVQTDPDIEFVAPDRPLHASGDLVAQTINADLVWASSKTGTGIGVAVVDSGIRSQFQDLGNPQGQTDQSHARVVYAENFLVPATKPDGTVNQDRYKTKDGYGHGTHVAGIIAGNGYISLQPGSIRSLAGIAPTANLIDLQVLDQNGQGSDSTVIAAIDRAISLKSTYQIRVINLSLGRPVFTSFTQDPLCLAVERAWQAGIVVVVAAGNDGRNTTFGGYGTINAPGNDPLAITVGAMRTAGTPYRYDDEITTYSSRGPSLIDHIVKPDLVAPGNLIDAAFNQDGYLEQNYSQNNVDPLTVFNPGAIPQYVQSSDPGSLPDYYRHTNYYTLSGTSMAAAVTSGAVALLLTSEPNLTPDQVKARLMLTASKNFTNLGPYYFNNTTKGQKLNVEAQHLTIFVLPTYQKPVNDAQNQLNNANSQLQQQQAAQTTAASAVSNAQQALTAPTAAAAAALQTYNQASALDTQMRAKVNTDQATSQTDQQALQAANDALHKSQDSLNQANQCVLQDQQNAQQDYQHAQQDLANNNTQQYNQDIAKYNADLAKLNTDSALVTQYTAQVAAGQTKYNTLTAQVAADSAAITADQNAAQAQDIVMQTAQQASNSANDTLKHAQDALQQAQNNLTNANNQVANAQNQVNQAQANLATAQANLAAEQATISGLQQQASNYLSQSGASSTPYVSQYDIFTIGAGYLDINAAVQNHAVSPQNAGATSPVAYFNPANGTVTITSNYKSLCGSSLYASTAVWGTTICGNMALWGSNSVWGNMALWGSNSVSGNMALWGSTAVWGTSLFVNGSMALWGSTAVWGTSGTAAFNALWGSTAVWGTSGPFGAATDYAASSIAVMIDGDTNR